MMCKWYYGLFHREIPVATFSLIVIAIGLRHLCHHQNDGIGSLIRIGQSSDFRVLKFDDNGLFSFQAIVSILRLHFQ